MTQHLDRRGFLAACSRAGITSALVSGVLYSLTAQAQDSDKSKEKPKIALEILDQAALLAGVTSGRRQCLRPSPRLPEAAGFHELQPMID